MTKEPKEAWFAALEALTRKGETFRVQRSHFEGPLKQVEFGEVVYAEGRDAGRDMLGRPLIAWSRVEVVVTEKYNGVHREVSGEGWIICASLDSLLRAGWTVVATS